MPKLKTTLQTVIQTLRKERGAATRFSRKEAASAAINPLLRRQVAKGRLLIQAEQLVSFTHTRSWARGWVSDYVFDRVCRTFEERTDVEDRVFGQILYEIIRDAKTQSAKNGVAGHNVSLTKLNTLEKILHQCGSIARLGEKTTS